MDTRKDRQFVDALARGLAILECLSRANTPLGNGELARLIGLLPSTISRLTRTLTELGYLQRSQKGRMWELTPKNLTLGYPLLAGMGLRDKVRPYLQKLSTDTGQTMALAVRDGLYMCYVDVIQGEQPGAIKLATGGRLRMNVSAAGVAALAAMPEPKRWSTLLRLRSDLEQRNESTKAFEEALQACYKLGYAMIRNTWQSGIGGVSVAIAWQDQHATLAMPIPTASVSAQRMHNELAPKLLAAAQSISTATPLRVMNDEPANRAGHIDATRG